MRGEIFFKASHRISCENSPPKSDPVYRRNFDLCKVYVLFLGMVISKLRAREIMRWIPMNVQQNSIKKQNINVQQVFKFVKSKLNNNLKFVHKRLPEFKVQQTKISSHF